MSIDYYNQFADTFSDATLDVDMSSLYARFEPLLKPGAQILDAGCGSGRDTRYFLGQGFAVVAMDASEALCKLAAELTGLSVHTCRFDEFQYDEPFDGIWACASLLHVPSKDLPGVMVHLASQLISGGVFYCSFKYGVGEETRDGRTFTHLDESNLATLLQTLPLQSVDVWQTSDLRPGREQGRWLNAILIKE